MRESPVVDVDRVMLPALAAELEADGATRDANVLVAQRGQPERVILPRILLVADANETALEQLHERRQHLLARQTRPRQVGACPSPEGRQRTRERLHTIELRLVTCRAPVGVIPVLLALLRIPTGRLQVATRVWTDPHIRPRRRDRKRADAGENFLASNHLPVGA